MDIEFEKLDVKSIEGHEWALELRKYVIDYTEQCVLNWCKIVLQLGHGEVEMDKWLHIFKHLIEERCKEIVLDVAEMKAKVSDNVANLMQKFENYCRQLNLDENLLDINPDNGYYVLEKQLLKRTERLENMIMERREQINLLLKKQNELCIALEEKPYTISLSPLPSKEKTEDLRIYLEKLRNERFVREERYMILKERITEMAKELDLVPITDFQRQILIDCNTEYDIRNSNLENMEKFQNDLTLQINNMKEEIDMLRENIENLWKILDQSMTEKISFYEKYSNYSMKTLKALRVEVKRCEDLKKANIKIFVEKLRSDLRSLWKNCYQKNEEEFCKYAWFTTDFYNEDLLQIHENEVNRWNEFYNRNKELIKLLSEHERLWNRLLDMQNKDAEGINRFKNRGGELLKEEKERNKLSKRIPIIEEKIKELCQEEEDHQAEPFNYWGTPVLEYLDKLHCQREEDRRNKLSARKQIRDQEPLTPAKPCLTLFPSTSRMATPLSSTKRKLNSIKSTGKKTKMTVASKALNVSSISSDKLHRIKRHSIDKNKRVAKCRKALALRDTCNKENMEVTGIEGYDDFEKSMTKREDLHHSTVLPADPRRPFAIIPTLVVIPDSPAIGLKTPNSSKANRSGKPKTPRSATKLTKTPSNLKLIF